MQRIIFKHTPPRNWNLLPRYVVITRHWQTLATAEATVRAEQSDRSVYIALVLAAAAAVLSIEAPGVPYQQGDRLLSALTNTGGDDGALPSLIAGPP
jgi:hypothetical protein